MIDISANKQALPSGTWYLVKQLIIQCAKKQSVNKVDQPVILVTLNPITIKTNNKLTTPTQNYLRKFPVLII